MLFQFRRGCEPLEYGSRGFHGANTAMLIGYTVADTNPTGCGGTGSSRSSSAGASNLYSTGVTNRAISVLDTSPPMITHASGE